MSFGDLKVQDLIYEDSSNNEITVVIADLATKANPVFSGTVTVPTATAGDNSTKAASTAFVVASFAPKNAPAFTGSATGVNLTLSGDLTVNGTTTTINTTTLQVEDKNIEIGKVSSPSDTTADGGGWSLLGATTKTFNWVNATDAWTSSEHIHIGDNKKFLAGTDSDLEMYHTGSGAYIQNKTGNLFIGSNFDDDDGGDIRIQAKYGENSIVALDDGSVELYYDNVKKLETISWGVDCQGNTRTSGDFVCLDNGKFRAGNSSDLQIFHNGSHNYIKCGNDGQDIYIESSKDLYLKTGDGSTGNHTAIYAADNAGVQIKYDNNTKLTTTNTGINVTGAISVNGSPLAGGNTFTAVANGAIANNKAVKIDDDGKVSEIKVETSARLDPAYVADGNAINGGSDYRWSMSFYDTTLNRAIVVYYVDNYIKGKIGTPNSVTAPTSFSFGTEATLASSVDGSGFDACYDTNTQRVVVAFRNSSGNGRVCVCKPVGGSTNTISSANEIGFIGTVESVAAVYEPTSQKVILAAEWGSNRIIKSQVGTVTGGFANTITLETSVFIIADASAHRYYLTNFVPLTSGKFLLQGSKNSDNKMYCFVGSISGTTVTWQSAVNISSAAGVWGTAALNTVTNNVTFAWRRSSDNRPMYRPAVLSGNSLSMGTEDVMYNIAVNTNAYHIRTWYEPLSNTTLIAYHDASNNKMWYEKHIHTSGTTAPTNIRRTNIWTVATKYVGDVAVIGNLGLTLSANAHGSVNRILYFLTNHVEAATNLTHARKFVGFADQAYTNGQTATIKTYGNNVSTLSGLTIGSVYYVQGDGTVGTSWDSTRFASFASNTPKAGTAIAADTILIRDPEV